MKKIAFVVLAFAFSTAAFAQQTTKTPAKSNQEVKKVATAKPASAKTEMKKTETKTEAKK